jgi:long-chain acyl-CoA synthetase
LIKTSYGKYVNPLKVESMLRDLPGVAEAMVVGEGRPYGIALLWMEDENLVSGVDAAIKEVNVHLSHPEQVKAWAVLPNDLSIETGELTANMKLRRPWLVQQYAGLIDSLYSDEVPKETLHVGRAGRDA